MSHTQMNRVGFALATSWLFLSWLGCGYSYVATTPGARPLVLESPAVAEAGSVAISGQATFRNEDEQDSAQENSMIGSGKVRVGVGGSTELQLEGQYRGTLGQPRSPTPPRPGDVPSVTWADFTNRSGIAGRIGFRSNILEFRGHPIITLGAGLGVGALPGGTHLSPEIVVSGGYQNGAIYPFMNLRIGVGVPTNARLTLEGRDTQNIAQTFSPSYETTCFTSIDMGARVPLVRDGSLRPSLLFGGGAGYDFRLTDHLSGTTHPMGIAGPVGTVVYQFGLALELVIGDAPRSDQS